MTAPVDVLAVMDAAPSVTVNGVIVLHNTSPWRVATNRHPCTNGESWGWIEGAPGNVCWENGTRFDRAAAFEVVRLHAGWLEEQKPLSIRLVEAREAYAKAAKANDTANAAYQRTRNALRECEERIEALARCKGGAA